MACYDYRCNDCCCVFEVHHGMSEQPIVNCAECGSTNTAKKISASFYVSQSYHPGGTFEDHRESEHRKKVKDPDRAVRMRKQAFGHDEVGDPKMESDPRHIVRRGRALGGQQTEVNKQEFIKAAARDPAMVKLAQDAIQKSQQRQS